MSNSNLTTYESTKTEINCPSMPCCFLYFPAFSLRTLQTVSGTSGKALRYSHYLHWGSALLIGPRMCSTIQSAGWYSYNRQWKQTTRFLYLGSVHHTKCEKRRSFKGFGVWCETKVIQGFWRVMCAACVGAACVYVFATKVCMCVVYWCPYEYEQVYGG